MKLLLDQGLPRSAADLLRSRGYDAVHTLDADFHALLAINGATGPSVVRIRIERLRAAALADLVQLLLERWGTLLERGAVLTVLPDRVRVHHLPIG